MRMIFALIVVAICAIAVGAYVMRPANQPVLQSSIPLNTKLGTPGNHSPSGRLPNLPMDLVFDQANGRIISRQDNGAVMSWDIKAGTSSRLAPDSKLFAYCQPRQLLLQQRDADVVLFDVKNQQYKRVMDGVYHHAAWDKDCSTFAVASEDNNVIRRWKTQDLARHAIIHTVEPIRNGLAMSPDGQFIAAAEGKYTEGVGHQTRLEIFKTGDGGDFLRGNVDNRPAAIMGMWTMRFSPDGRCLVVGSQINAKSGVRCFSPQSGELLWRKEGCESYWVRAIATSPDGKLVATGDEKGHLRLWDAMTGRKLYDGKANLVIQTVAFSDDGKQLAIAFWDSTIGIANLADMIK